MKELIAAGADVNTTYDCHRLTDAPINEHVNCMADFITAGDNVTYRNICFVYCQIQTVLMDFMVKRI